MKLLQSLSLLLFLPLWTCCGNKTNNTVENKQPEILKKKKGIDTILLKNEAKSGFDTLIMDSLGKILKDTRSEFNYSNSIEGMDSAAYAQMIADSTRAMVLFDSMMKIENRAEALEKSLKSFTKSK